MPKSPIGLKRLVMWPVTADDADDGITYGNAVNFTKQLMTASATPSVAEASQEADDMSVEHVVTKDGGELDIGVTALTSAERALIYGENVVNSTNVENKDDMSPYVAVAYMAPRSDGKVNLYKYPKVCFAPQQESLATRKKGGIEYATTSIKGTYMPELETGDAVYRAFAVDPTTDAARIAAWFTDAGAIIAPAQSGGTGTGTGTGE